VPPLIKIKLVLNGTINIFGIYDSGSNVSLINSKLLNLKNNKIKNAQNTQNANLKTINVVKKTIGMITINVKKFRIIHFSYHIKYEFVIRKERLE